MSCPYYTFRYGDYYCLKACKEVKDSAYYKYCRNYDYSDCPAYKMSSEYRSDYEYLSMYKGNSDDDSSSSSSSSGGCFLTSACTAARGLPDDCHELTVLRNFRDNWLKHQPDGVMLIAHYYEVAPKIVEAIDQRENRLEIWDEVYMDVVLPCMELIQVQRYDEALTLYQNFTIDLEQKYCK